MNCDFGYIDDLLQSSNGKIIHQVWFNMGNGGTPEKYKHLIKTWKEKNPKYTYHLWDEKDSLELLTKYYPFFLSTWKKYPHTIQRIDSIRYFFLHRYGGFYCDTDTRCMKPIDKMFETFRKKVYLAETPNNIISNTASNFLMYSEPMNGFWEKVYIEMAENAKKNYHTKHFQVMMTTGPMMLTSVYRKYGNEYDVGLLPKELFNPCGMCSETCDKRDMKGVYVINENASSWTGSDTSILKFLLCKKWYILGGLVILGIFVIRSKLRN